MLVFCFNESCKHSSKTQTDQTTNVLLKIISASDSDPDPDPDPDVLSEQDHLESPRPFFRDLVRLKTRLTALAFSDTQAPLMSSTTPSTLHPVALSGFANSSSYDAHRPSYPSEAVSALLRHLNLTDKQGARILDLAAGTGKFTELLAAQPPNYDIIAVEPHDGMRAELERKSLPRVGIRKGFATDIPVEHGWADAVICAQSFHWFSTPEALASIARVLRSRGSLGLVWNIEDYNNTLRHKSPHPWTRTLRELVFGLDAREEAGAVRFRNERWRTLFRPTADTCPFFDIQEAEFAWTTWLEEEALWQRFSTLSQIANLDQEQLVGVKRRFEEAMAEEGTERDGNGRIAVRGSTVVVWTSKTT